MTLGNSSIAKGEVYGVSCTCPKLYAGKTTQELRRQGLKHLSTFQTNADTPLTWHIRDVHGGDMKTLTFLGITKPKLGPHAGNKDRLLLQIEAQWLYQLKALSPIRLNEGFSYI